MCLLSKTIKPSCNSDDDTVPGYKLKLLRSDDKEGSISLVFETDFYQL